MVKKSLRKIIALSAIAISIGTVSSIGVSAEWRHNIFQLVDNNGVRYQSKNPIFQ